jgi:hypothetical protein
MRAILKCSVLVWTLAAPAMALVELRTDPLEPSALGARWDGLAGVPPLRTGDNLRLWAGWDGQDPTMMASCVTELDARLSLDLLVVGMKGEDVKTRLGSSRQRDDLSGRVMRGLVRYQGSKLDFEFGRDRPANWTQGVDHPALRNTVLPVDLARLTFKSPRYGLEVGSQLVSLPTPKRRSGFRRWMNGHRLTWVHGAWEVELGDWILYTGQNRGIEPAYLNPLIPSFVGTFEQIPQADSLSRYDNDNNLMCASVTWATKGAPTTWRVRLDVVVDEFQIDSADRSRMDDVLGVRMVAGTRSTRETGTWQGALSISALSSWLYQHPGNETDWSAYDASLGHAAGGDLLEAVAGLAWRPNSRPRGQRVALWTEGCGVALEGGVRHKGAIVLADPWNPERTSGQSMPTSPLGRIHWLTGDLLMGWNVGAHGVMQTGALLRWFDAPGKQENGFDLQLVLRLGLMWDESPAPLKAN